MSTWSVPKWEIEYQYYYVGRNKEMQDSCALNYANNALILRFNVGRGSSFGDGQFLCKALGELTALPFAVVTALNCLRFDSMWLARQQQSSVFSGNTTNQANPSQNGN